MNKNKMIFTAVWAVLLSLIAFLATNLANSNTPTQQTSAGWFTVWILDDSKEDFMSYFEGFKSAYPQFAGVTPTIESFQDHTTYQNALSSAVVAGQAPDIFVLSNWETSVTENQIMGIDPSVVSPNEFRQNFKTVFSEDLILTDESDDTVEFLKGVPAGYEVLGMYYNRKYFLRPSEMTTWSNVTKEVKTIADKHSKIIPIALWNGVGITRYADVITSLFALEGSKSLMDLNDVKAKQVLAMYSEFGQKNGDNRYNILSAPFVEDTDIEFFTQWDVAAMVWYPRDLLAIDKIGYQKSFLFAAPFPHYAGDDKSIAIKYNYFTINKDTTHRDVALWFMQYLSSTQGQQAYVDIFPYYLSPEASVEAGMLEKKILPAYNIVYKNFTPENTTLVSYNVWNKSIFENGLKPVLDLEAGYDSKFSELKSYTICSATKYSSLLNLSSSCK